MYILYFFEYATWNGTALKIGLLVSLNIIVIPYFSKLNKTSKKVLSLSPKR